MKTDAALGETTLDEVVKNARERIEKRNGKSAEELWEEKNNRLANAINLREPDKVPVLLHSGDFPISYAGLSASAAYYDPDSFRKAFIEMMADLEPDTCNGPEDVMLSGQGMSALRITQVQWPGGDLPEDGTLQFMDSVIMKAEEYDLFITDPTDFMLRYYLPRRFEALAPLGRDLPPLGQSLGGNVPGFFWMSPAFVTEEFQEMARHVFTAGVEQSSFTSRGEIEALGIPNWVHPGGVCTGFTPGTSQPFDWFADQLRGMKGIVDDMFNRPEKLILACERLLEWRIARAVPADPNEKEYPKRVAGGVTHWSFDTFLSNKQFETFCWPTWKQALLTTIDLGFTPCVYFEGRCDDRVEYFLEMPKGKVVIMFERSDIPRAKAILRDHVCICGEVPSGLIQLASTQEVEEYCRDLIKVAGEGGGFILSAEAGLTRGAKPENVRAIVDSAKKYGTY